MQEDGEDDCIVLLQCDTVTGQLMNMRLEHVQVRFRTYSGLKISEERLGAGKKSMAYSLVYRAADRTLTSEEVDKAHDRLVKKVSGATGAEMRA